MQCPICSTPLASRQVAGVDACVCRAGHGLTLKQSALLHALRRRVSDPNTPPADFEAEKHFALHTRQEHRPCPECRGAMTTYNYAYNSNIFLDRCDACGLVWLDARELGQLATYLKGNPRVDRLGAAMARLLREFNQPEECDYGISRWATMVTPGPLGYTFYLLSQAAMRYTNGPARLAIELVLLILVAALLLAGYMLNHYYDELQ